MNKRSYKQQCALARALDMVGDRWTFLIIRELIIAPKRYKMLAENLKGMGTNLLATRLKELEEAMVIERIALTDSKLFAYQLTAFGRELEEPILAIIRWGFKLPVGDESDYLSVDEWDLVALKAAFRPERAENLNVVVEFVAGALRFFVSVRALKVDILLEPPGQINASLNVTIETLIQIDAGTLMFEQAVKRKLLKFTGDLGLIERVLQCFSMSRSG